jgi:hypothetical protein
MADGTSHANNETIPSDSSEIHEISDESMESALSDIDTTKEDIHDTTYEPDESISPQSPRVNVSMRRRRNRGKKSRKEKDNIIPIPPEFPENILYHCDSYKDNLNFAFKFSSSSLYSFVESDKVKIIQFKTDGEIQTFAKTLFDAFTAAQTTNNEQNNNVTASLNPKNGPKFDCPMLTGTGLTSNFRDWQGPCKANLMKYNLWFDPKVDPQIDITSPEDIERSTQAVSWMASKMDRDNKALIECYGNNMIDVWKGLESVHRPVSMSVLLRFINEMQEIEYTPGTDYVTHIAKLDLFFNQLTIVEDVQLPEAFKCAIFLSSIRNVPELSHFITNATSIKVKDISLTKLKHQLASCQYVVGNQHNANVAKHSQNPNFGGNRKYGNIQRPSGNKRPHTYQDCVDKPNHETYCVPIQKKAAERGRNRRIKKQKPSSYYSHDDNANEKEEEESNHANHFATAFHTGARFDKFESTRPSVHSRLGPQKSHNNFTSYSLNVEHDDTLSIHGEDIESGDDFIPKEKHLNNKLFLSQTKNYHIEQKSKNEFHETSTSANEFYYLHKMNCYDNYFACTTELKADKNKLREEFKNKSNWVIDSGASIHMTHEENILDDYVSAKGINVICSNNTKVPIVGFGKLNFSMKCHLNHIHKFCLNKVAHVPDLAVNLISIRNLELFKNSSVIFANNNCYLNIDSHEFILGKASPSLYMMELQHDMNRMYYSNICIHQLHKMMSHKNLAHVKEVSKVLHIKVSKCTCSDTCVSCIKSKIASPPYPKESEKPKYPREIITSDICFIQQRSIDHKTCFITFNDAACGYTEVVTLRNKSEAIQATKNFMEKCFNFFGRYPKIFRSDRGLEYVNSDLRSFLKSKGIRIELTCANSPSQNGISERKNRTLVEAVRTILNERNLPFHLWGEALYYATQTFNSIPKLKNSKSPAEIFYNKTLKHEFREFGTPVIFNPNANNVSKLSPKGVEGLFVGIDLESKGYRIYYNNSIHIRRIVHFIAQNPNKKQNESDEDKNVEPVKSVIHDKTKKKPTIEKTQVCKPLRRSERIAALVSDGTEISAPNSYTEAMKRSDAEEWLNAMNKELSSIEKHETWDWVDIPKDKKLMGCRWVLSIKETPTESIYKARLVAQGCSQVEGENYFNTFAPVAYPTSFRIMMIDASKHNKFVKQFDVTTAFLHGPLTEEIFMKPPPGFSKEGKVLKLKKSLYGLKQAAFVWNQTLDECLIAIGFTRSAHDPCVYFIRETYECHLLVHVDDMIMSSQNENFIDEMATKISSNFELKSMGFINRFLGINVIKDEQNNYKINQSHYIEKIAETFDLTDAKHSPYPLDPGYYKIECDTPFLDNTKYRQIIGMLMYIAINSRPDIATSVNILSQKLVSPSNLDWNEAQRIVKYLLKTKNVSLHFNCVPQAQTFTCHSDADWANDKNDRKSRTGYICRLYGSVIAWTTKKQTAKTAISTTEAEFYALAEAAKEVAWIISYLEELKIDLKLPVPIYVDNNSCIKKVNGNSYVSRTKHIGTRYNYVKDYIKEKLMELHFVPSHLNVADMFTKPLYGSKLEIFLITLNMK